MSDLGFIICYAGKWKHIRNFTNERVKDNLMDMLTAYVKVHPEVDIEIIIPHRENMEQLLKLL